MKAVIQRVQRASVVVDGQIISTIGKGILTLLGVAPGDDETKAAKLMEKIVNLRIFEDSAGKMNLSLKDVGGEHLIVSQFTLLADCSKGTRPSFTGAEKPERAQQLYDEAILLSAKAGIKTSGGVFGAHMDVSIHNDGPVTLILEA